MINKRIKNSAHVIKSYKTKWREFLLLYGVVNVIALSSIYEVVRSIYEEYGKLFVNDFYMDGANLSILVNAFALPIFLGMSMAAILFNVFIQGLIIWGFKSYYLSSAAPEMDRERLFKQQRRMILVFWLIASASTLGFFDLSKILFAILLYLPIPLMTYIMLSQKIRGQVVMCDVDEMSVKSEATSPILKKDPTNKKIVMIILIVGILVVVFSLIQTWRSVSRINKVNEVTPNRKIERLL